MAAPLSKRFPDAKTALEALKPLYVKRVPEVKFFINDNEWSQSKKLLKFEAKKPEEKITKTFTFINSTPETNLDGTWEVIPNSNDPHPWISFSRQKFQGKKVEEGQEDSVECQIIIDTKNLAPAKTLNRKIRLKLNTEQKGYDFDIEVKTALLDNIRIPYKALSLLAITLAMIAFVTTTNVNPIVKGVENVSIQSIIQRNKIELSKIENQIKNSNETLEKMREELSNSKHSLTSLTSPLTIFGLVLGIGIIVISISEKSNPIRLILGTIFILPWINDAVKRIDLLGNISVLEGKIETLDSSRKYYISISNLNNDELKSLAIQEYWSNNTPNINLIIGIATSLAAGLLYFAYSYLSRKGKYKIKNPLLEIVVLLLITSIAIATGIGFQISFNYWYILLPIILPTTILVTMQVRYVTYILRLNTKKGRNPKLIYK